MNMKFADDINGNNKKELFKKNITKFCLEVAENNKEQDIDEIGIFLNDMNWGDDNFDPAVYFKFEPICALSTSNTNTLFKPVRHVNLFGKYGHLLADSCGMFYGGLSTQSERYELWLLEDMSLAVTYCFEMSVEYDNEEEKVEYRRPMKCRFDECGGDFEVIDFLENLEDEIIFSTNCR